MRTAIGLAVVMLLATGASHATGADSTREETWEPRKELSRS